MRNLGIKHPCKSAEACLPLLTAFFGVAVFVFAVVKASTSCFTHDESYSYLHFVHHSFMDILSYKQWYTNNHLLNTLLMKYSGGLFGPTEFALRLPNILLFGLYLGAAFRILRRMDPWLSLAIFTLLITNVMLTDFFGLARGYGLSIGFMMAGLYFFMKAQGPRRVAFLIAFHLSFLLASLSSFTMLTVYASLILTDNVIRAMAVDGAGDFFRGIPGFNKVHLIMLLLNSLVLYEPVRRVLTHNAMDFGGKEGFFQDTVSFLIYHSFHNTFLPPRTDTFFQVLFTATVLAGSAWILRACLRRKEIPGASMRGLVISNLLLLLVSIIIVLQHYILGSDYPVARFSLFLFPLFVIHLGFLLDQVQGHAWKRMARLTALALALISTGSFLQRATIHSSGEWHYDSETRHMLEVLERVHLQGSDEGRVSLGIDWFFEPTVNFYRKTRSLDWLLPVGREGVLARKYDYYYTFQKDAEVLIPFPIEPIERFDRTGTLLFREGDTTNTAELK